VLCLQEILKSTVSTFNKALRDRINALILCKIQRKNE